MNLRLPKSVVSIVVVRPDSSQRMVSTTIYEAERKKKKPTPMLRPMEKAVRRFAKGGQSFADAYMARHEQSNQQERDGWLRDLGYNVFRASDKGVRKLL